MIDTFTTMGSSPLHDVSSPGTKGSLSFQAGAYDEYRADFEMTEAEWADLLKILWPIMVAFADYGLGMHPLQHVLGLAVAPENLAPDSEDMLASQGSSFKNNNKMTGPRPSGRHTGGE
jgi:hypothetical protein